MSKILIVDDERDVCNALSVLLDARDGSSVEIATTPRGAIELAGSYSPDLLIVDWMLSDEMDGLQLARTLRQSNPSLSVILVTGHPASDLQAQIESPVNTWVLQKPFGMSELRGAIEVALRPT